MTVIWRESHTLPVFGVVKSLSGKYNLVVTRHFFFFFLQVAYIIHVIPIDLGAGDTWGYLYDWTPDHVRLPAETALLAFSDTSCGKESWGSA